MSQFASYRDILNTELAERCSMNPRYSLRAFARDLGLNPSRLSEVLNGKQGLSEKSGMTLAKALGFTLDESHYFCDLVQAEAGRSRQKRAEAKARLFERHQERRKTNHLSEERFKVISEWYHFALMELTTLKSFRNDTAWMAKKLGISQAEVTSGIDRLKTLGLMSEEGGMLKQTQANVYTTDDVPSKALPIYHTQLLEKAITALKMQRVDEREISSLMISINMEDLPEVKKRIKQFKHELNIFLEEKKTERDETYLLGLQFFRLTEPE